MTRFVGTPLRGIEFSSVSDEAFSTRVLGDGQARIRIDAGGRLTWSSGSAAGDVTLYRDGADQLTTDDVFEATGGLITLVTNGVPTEALPNGAIAVDTTNHVFYFRSNGTWNEVQSGANVTIASTVPAGAEEGDLWFNSTDLELYIFYGSAFIQLTGTDSLIQDLDDLVDVEITDPQAEDVIAWDGEKWVNSPSYNRVTVSATVPTTGLREGELWYNTTDLEVYVYYSSSWIQLTGTESLIQDLDDLVDVDITAPTANQVLQWDGEKWVNATLALTTDLDSLTDVNISSAASGHFLKWNGTAWVNDAIDLGTDTTGNYMSGISAGTGISVTHTPGEGSAATVGLDASLDDLNNVSASSPTPGQFLKWNGTAWVPDSVPIISSLDDVGDVTITSAANGDFLRWDGTAWINDAVNLSTDTVGDYVQSLVAGTGINITNNSGEATTPTIALDASLDEVSDVTITSAASGDYLKWNGTAWVNDPINLGTDTTGNYMSDVSAGTGISVSHTPGEGSSATVSLNATLDNLSDVNVPAPSDGQFLKYVSASSEWQAANIPTINNLDDIGDVTITSAGSGEVLQWNGTAWVNAVIESGASLTVSETPPAGPGEGDLWFESDTGATYVYYDSAWVEIGNSGAIPVPTLDSVGDVNVAAATSGQFLKWNGTEWVADDIPTINTLDDVGDVTITSAASGDFLKWNGAAWVNDAINLGTDTTGNYVSDLTAGTGITVTHTPSEGSSPTVSLNAALDNLSDVTITTPTTGQAVVYNGTAWVNDDIDSGSIADFDLVAPESYQTLVYDGTSWINEYPTTVSLVQNDEATTLNVGEAVYLFGGSGNHATVKRASNTSDATSSKTVGLVAAAIPAGGQGPVVTRGYVNGINLATGYTAGQVLWLNSTAGAFTTTKPSAPNHLVFIGVVVRATSNGIVYVATQNGYELDELHDVSISSPASGQFLKYDGSLWVNDAINLGTDTTGDYVSSLVAGTGVSLTNNSGEGATPTIGIGQAVGTTDNVTFNDVVVNGDLTVNGTTTALNTATLEVEDNIVTLNSGVTGSPTLNAGLEVERGTSTNVALRWNETTDKWEITNNGTTYDSIATAGDVAGVAISSLDDVGDVTITSASTGDALVWNGTAWVNDTIVGGATVSATAPAAPEEGALWFDSDSGLTFVYYGSNWVEVGSTGSGARVTVSASAPASPDEGDMWFDSDTTGTFVYYDSTWVEVGASGFAAVVGDAAPSSPVEGQLWLNSTDGGTYVYYDSVWMEVGAAPFNELLGTIDAKGDLLVGTADDTVDRLAAGTNGQVLTANSATATGLEWTTLSYAPTASPTFTGTVVLPSGTSIGTVSSTEIGYLDGVTSSIQTQLDAKASTGKAIAMAIVFGGG